MESVPGWRAIDLARHYGSKNASITRTRFALLVSPPRKRWDFFFFLRFFFRGNEIDEAALNVTSLSLSYWRRKLGTIGALEKGKKKTPSKRQK